MGSPDVIIAGAGIIGISLALELRTRGADVLVLDRAQPGSEASSAAAGMLAASDPETPVALRRLALESARLFPEFVSSIESASGISTDFRRPGTIAVGEHLGEVENHRTLSAEELKHMEPALAVREGKAFFVSEDSIDPALLMKAALQAAAQAGIEIRGGVNVLKLQSSSGNVEVLTRSERFAAKAAVNCCGAWAGAPVKPRKGQMLYLAPERSRLLQHVVRTPEVYVVPRSSGQILVGATVEDTGFDKTVDSSTIRGLHGAAARYIPNLAAAPISDSWAGLRPGTPDDLPILGELEDERVFVASGHFRNGILLAPITARIMADLLLLGKSGNDISAFSPRRFTLTNAIQQ